MAHTTVDKPDGAISFEEAARSFTGKPYRLNKFIWLFLSSLGGYQVTRTEYGHIVGVLGYLVTPIPITGDRGCAEPVGCGYAERKESGTALRNAIVRNPIAWTRRMYYQHKAQEIKRSAQGLPCIPDYYEKQWQWYAQQEKQCYHQLFNCDS